MCIEYRGWVQVCFLGVPLSSMILICSNISLILFRRSSCQILSKAWLMPLREKNFNQRLGLFFPTTLWICSQDHVCFRIEMSCLSSITDRSRCNSSFSNTSDTSLNRLIGWYAVSPFALLPRFGIIWTTFHCEGK